MAAINGQPRRYLSPQEVVDEYGFSSLEHLRRLARSADGPPYLKIGHLLRFDRVDLDAWMDAQRQR